MIKIGPHYQRELRVRKMAAVIREVQNIEKWSQEWECLEEEIANLRVKAFTSFPLLV